jgi:hypothetical protein
MAMEYDISCILLSKRWNQAKFQMVAIVEFLKSLMTPSLVALYLTHHRQNRDTSALKYWLPLIDLIVKDIDILL